MYPSIEPRRGSRTRFRFAGNNPVNRIDPSGLSATQSLGNFAAEDAMRRGGFTVGGIDFGPIFGGLLGGPSGGGSSGGGFAAIRETEALARQVGRPAGGAGLSSPGDLVQSVFGSFLAPENLPNTALSRVDGRRGVLPTAFDFTATFQSNFRTAVGGFLRSNVDAGFDLLADGVGFATGGGRFPTLTTLALTPVEFGRSVSQIGVNTLEALSDPVGTVQSIGAGLQRSVNNAQTVRSNLLQTGGGQAGSAFNAAAFFLADVSGVRQVEEAFVDVNALTGLALNRTLLERSTAASLGLSQAAGSVAGGLSLATTASTKLVEVARRVATPKSLGPKLQRLTTRAAKTVDSLGDKAFTPKQLAAIDRNPRLRPAFRGFEIDRMVRDLVRDNPRLSSRLTGRINKGVDFTDTRTGEIFDITTRAQTRAKQLKFGDRVQILVTDP